MRIRTLDCPADMGAGMGHERVAVGCAMMSAQHGRCCMPKSMIILLLLMMACAFGGFELVLEAYQTAIKEKYRFLSYGDVMLID